MLSIFLLQWKCTNSITTNIYFMIPNIETLRQYFCSEHFGRTTAASQYFLQLAGYLGIPVISWNADNSGLERRVSRKVNSKYNLKFLFTSVAIKTQSSTGSKHRASSSSHVSYHGQVKHMTRRVFDSLRS